MFDIVCKRTKELIYECAKHYDVKINKNVIKRSAMWIKLTGTESANSDVL